MNVSVVKRDRQLGDHKTTSGGPDTTKETAGKD